ncbi:MAG TPA: GtrA family protein [Sphingomonas sp.]|uniref:GtrA family protein n=1 Tax=Sphingomonas sp. TaxID=28214 RepID=UPI002B87EB14|nr:GtrA family protein [Sphingomonas sp.]HMI18415.1 GtrA family protein [Sphingomonas sp.]
MRPLIPDGGRQPARYLISGGVCALANNALLIGGARAGLGILELTLLSFLVIGTAGYVAHVHFTFRQAPGWRSYARFMAGVALGIPAAYAVLALLCDVLHVSMLAAAPIATVVLLVYNYLSARLAIMRRLVR